MERFGIHGHLAALLVRPWRHPSRATRRFLRKTSLSVLSGIAFSIFPIQNTIAQSAEQQVKAAFLYHFCSYVQWPGAAPFHADTTVVVGVAGSRKTARFLEKNLQSKRTGRCNLQVQPVKPNDDLKDIHILYVTHDGGFSLKDFRALERNPPVLTITEEPYMPNGSIINFVVLNDYVRFQVSNSRAGETGLKLSSQLLSVAVHVN